MVNSTSLKKSKLETPKHTALSVFCTTHTVEWKYLPQFVKKFLFCSGVYLFLKITNKKPKNLLHISVFLSEYKSSPLQIKVKIGYFTDIPDLQNPHIEVFRCTVNMLWIGGLEDLCYSNWSQIYHSTGSTCSTGNFSVLKQLEKIILYVTIAVVWMIKRDRPK